MVQEIIAGVAAVASLFVAVLAIWGEPIRRRFVGAKLRLRLLDPNGEPIDVAAGPARYYHVVVSNLRPHAIATNAHVVMTKVKRATAQGQYPDTTLMHGLSAPLPLIRQHQDRLGARATIGPDANFDLVAVVKTKGAAIQLQFVPNNLDRSIQANTRTAIELVAVCDQMQSDPLCVEIVWDGQFSLDTPTMAQHFLVKPMRRLP